MKIISSIIVASIAVGGIAKTSEEKHSLGLLGNLVRTNSQGDYKYPNASAFNHNGTRGYVMHFAKLLAAGSGQVSTYEDVMNQGIRVWNEENKPKGFTNDIASGLAFFTYVNLALAKDQDYKDYLFPNLVSQYRKSLMSKSIATLSNQKKQDIYDYLIAQSVYMQALASMGRDKNPEAAAKQIHQFSTVQIRETFGVDPSALSISESGLAFN